MSGHVLILGATSGIGRAIAERLADAGKPLVLAGRDAKELTAIAGDLVVRHQVPVETRVFEARDLGTHAAFFEECRAALHGDLGGVIVCQGYLGDQLRAQRDLEEAQAIMEVNYVSCVRVLNLAAEHLEQRGAGFICGIGSVAGDRGRQSNYLYGSAKGGFDRYLQGLRHRLAATGVTVTTVKPGFVDTAMTYGMPGMFLVAAPQRVADDVCRAVARGRSVIYTPWFWRYIMLIIRHVPEMIFKRTRL